MAGLFYPQSAVELERSVNGYLAGVTAPVSLPGRVKAIIAPHAGYVYSAAIAAHAFRQVESLRGTIDRAVLIGPAHRVYLRGCAVPKADAFQTPLGKLPIDDMARRAILDLSGVIADDRPHAEEHCLEVELPFLQVLFGAIRILPIVVGKIEAEHLAAILECVWGELETLIVASSDLSHYHDYDTAVALDRDTAASILGRSSELQPDQACGALALNGLMLAARAHGLDVVELERLNSGDTAGDRHRVVGYAAYALHERAH